MRTIRGRLLAMFLIGLVVVLTAGGAAVYWIARAGMIREMDAGLQSRAHTLSSLVKFEPWKLVFEWGDAPPVTLRETYFEIRTESGEMLKRSDLLSGQPLPARVPEEGQVMFGDVDLPGEVRGRAAWLAFRPRSDADDWGDRTPPEAPEALVVAAALDRAPVDRALASLLLALVVVGGALGVTVGALVMFGVRWGLGPLRRLSTQLGDVDAQTISTRFDDSRVPRELAPVYRELNRMLDRVERTIERERSFADAAAHELRTPLAELRSTAEVAIRWPDTDRAAASLNEVLAIGQEMERLVESLLMVSRANARAEGDARLSGPRHTPVAPIVNRSLEHSHQTISEKSIQIRSDVSARDMLPVPAEALEIIARNLIDNAVQYTPPGGSITIACARHNGSLAFMVENGPVDLAEDDVPRLFEPFWRREQARSDRRHVGLGLTVVLQIALAVGAHVDVELAGDRLQIRVSAAAPIEQKSGDRQQAAERT